MTRPVINEAVENTPIKPSDWNENFENIIDYIENFLPSQTNKAGTVLKTNGVSASWGNSPANIYMAKTTLSSGNSQTITLADNTALYISTVTAATTYIFSTLNLTEKDTKAVTFELMVTMANTYTLTFPNTVSWLNGDTPDVSAAGTYLFAFRTVDGGSTWIGNLQGTR